MEAGREILGGVGEPVRRPDLGGGRDLGRHVRDGAQEIQLGLVLEAAEVGVDAARWFFASRAATTGIDFDIELAKKQSNENPVY
jgi:hypothetical protein